VSSPIQILIDISGLGDFSGPLDDVTNPNRVLIRRGFSCSRGKGQIKQFAQAEAGRCEFVLNNTSGDYDGLAPGMKVCVKFTGGAGGDFEFEDGDVFQFEDSDTFEFEDSPGLVIWTGVMDDSQEEVSQFLPAVRVFCLGMLSRLVSRTVSTDLLENITIGQAIEGVLTNAGWPLAERVMSVSAVNLPYYCLDNADPFQAIAQLVLTEGGSFYEAANGYFVFEDGTYRATQTRSIISQADYLDAVLKNRNPSKNYKDKVDACTVTVEDREAQPLDKIWELGSPLTLTANQVRKFQVRGNGWFKDAAIPSPFGTNAQQALTASAVLTNGSFVGAFRGEQFTINWNDDNAGIQAALVAVSTIGVDDAGLDNVVVGGGPFASGMPVTVTFRGTLKWQAVDLITIVSSSLNTVSSHATIDVVETTPIGDGINQVFTLTPSASPLTSGTFKMKVGSSQTGTILFSASAANMQTAWGNTSLFNPGDITGAGGPIATAPVTLEIIDTQIGSPPIGPMSVIESSLMASQPTATVAVAETVKGSGPDYVVTAGSIDSMEINRTSGSSLMLKVTAGASGATLSSLQLQAKPFSVVRSHQVAFPEEATDPTWVDDFISANGRPPRIESPSIWPGLSREDALIFCENFVNAYDMLRPTDEIEFEKTLTASDLEAMFEREVSDRATLTPGEFFAEKLAYSTDGVLMRANFGMEQVAS
jgi:hypothetical protein